MRCKGAGSHVLPTLSRALCFATSPTNTAAACATFLGFRLPDSYTRREEARCSLRIAPKATSESPSLAPRPVHWQWRPTYLLACPDACRLDHPPPLNTKQLVQPPSPPVGRGKKKSTLHYLAIQRRFQQRRQIKSPRFSFVPHGEPTSLLQRRT